MLAEVLSQEHPPISKSSGSVCTCFLLITIPKLDWVPGTTENQLPSPATPERMDGVDWSGLSYNLVLGQSQLRLNGATRGQRE